MQIEVVTLLPGLIEAGLAAGIVGRAAAAGRLSVGTENPGDHAPLPHRSVDDRPFGGGIIVPRRVTHHDSVLHIVLSALARHLLDQQPAIRNDQDFALLLSCDVAPPDSEKPLAGDSR